jgi:hypothetical protein
MDTSDKSVTRSEFLNSVGRKGMFLGLTGIGAGALHGTREVSDCFNHNYCDSCWDYKGCTLPEREEDLHERTEEI